MEPVFVQFHSVQKTIITDVKISLPVLMGRQQVDGEKHAYMAIWDTGSTNTVITRRVAERLKLRPIGRSEVFGVTGSSVESAFLVSISLPNSLQITAVRVIECPSLGMKADVLIGMDIISQGDLAILNTDNKTKFYFQLPSTGTISL